MKTLKPPQKPKKWTAEIRCSGRGNGNQGCEATLLVEEDDLFLSYSSLIDSFLRTDEQNTFITFKCHECGTRTDLPYDITIFINKEKLPKSQEEWEKIQDENRR